MTILAKCCSLQGSESLKVFVFSSDAVFQGKQISTGWEGQVWQQEVLSFAFSIGSFDCKDSYCGTISSGIKS